MNNPHCFFTVEATFVVHGVGTGLVGFTREQHGLFAKGDNVELRCPNGSVIRAKITAVEYPPSVIWCGERPANPRYALFVSAEEQQIPLGTEVWSCGG